MKNILFIASEAAPFIKTGGLADVVGSLPKYFDKTKYDVRVMIPKYRCIPEKYKDMMKYIANFYVDLAWRSQYVGLLKWNMKAFISILLITNFILTDISHTAIFIRILKIRILL